MRCSSIPSSLILVAAAALTFGACAAEQTEPGGSGATPPASNTGTPAAGSGTTTATAGATGGASTAGKTGSTTSPTTGAAAGGTATGSPTGAAGAKAGGAAGATTGGAAGATTGAAGGGAAGASTGAAGGGAAGGGAAAGGAVTFTKVHEEVLTGAGCATPGCHGNAQGPSKLGLADKAEAYMGLVGVMAMGSPTPGTMTGGCMGMPFTRVKAGDPASSLLITKLENKQTCGNPMPPNGSISADKVQLVRDWIMAGAKDD